ncbi:MAG TPA: acyl-CoA dehydrogenase family protein, partial [Trebonia sp.]|nr:acyl-CoA dehydrogenase family protein [Trebonia sp.]
MTWRGPALADDQRDLMSMLGDLAASRGTVLSDDPTMVGGLVATLVGLGVWTLGVPEENGGMGADHATTMAALAQIGRSWPALGLASAQAHAAAGLLAGQAGQAGDQRCSSLLRRVHDGTAAVAVADAASAHVHLHWDAGRDQLRGPELRGTV